MSANLATRVSLGAEVRTIGTINEILQEVLTTSPCFQCPRVTWGQSEMLFDPHGHTIICAIHALTGKDLMHIPTTRPQLRKTRLVIQFPNIQSSVFINFHL